MPSPFDEDGELLDPVVRRWCWEVEWRLMSDDEDLLLMTDRWMLPLLEEAARDCPKRAYVLGIVAHHARDSAHHALWDGAPRLAATLARTADWVAAARDARDPALVSYLERLAGYAQPAPVSEGQARQRVLDLRRCTPQQEVPVEMDRRADEWVARFDRANVTPGDLCIDALTGRMSAVVR